MDYGLVNEDVVRCLLLTTEHMRFSIARTVLHVSVMRMVLNLGPKITYK